MFPPGPMMLYMATPPETPEACGSWVGRRFQQVAHIGRLALPEPPRRHAPTLHPRLLCHWPTGQMLLDGNRFIDEPSQSVEETWGMLQYRGSENHWSANWLVLRFCMTVTRGVQKSDEEAAVLSAKFWRKIRSLV